MSRYIDADDVANAIYHHFPSVRTMADARSVIEEVPTIEAVSVVRCKECKWAKANGTYQWCGRLDSTARITADDYCSYGEREDKCKECWYWSEVHKRCENKCGCQFKPYGERKGE